MIAYRGPVRLAVIIPVFNERATLAEVIARIDAVPPPTDAQGRVMARTLVLVDDASTDGSREIVEGLGARPDIAAKLLHTNGGKGSAVAEGLRTALELDADVALIHDADFEYDPRDHASAVRPIIEGRADAVIGSRFAARRTEGPAGLVRGWAFERQAANRLLTALSNLTTGLSLTDMECCTKAFSRAVLERLEIRERRFGLEPEIVARLAAMTLPTNATERPVRVMEVPVSYDPRGYAEGKKITWRDGVAAVRCILKYAPAR